MLALFESFVARKYFFALFGMNVLFLLLLLLLLLLLSLLLLSEKLSLKPLIKHLPT